MKLELAGDLQTIYDAVVSFHAKHSRGPTVGEVCRALDVPTGKISHLIGAMSDLGLLEKREQQQPSGYSAIEVRLTDANPYDEDGP